MLMIFSLLVGEYDFIDWSLDIAFRVVALTVGGMRQRVGRL